MQAENSAHKIKKEAIKTKMKAIFYNMDIKNNICPDCGKKNQWIMPLLIME